MEFNIKDSPPAVGGLALANFGMSIMIYTVNERQFSSKSDAMLAFVYLFIALGVIMVVIYIVRFLVSPVSYFVNDFASPGKISSVGTFAMAVCLMGKAIRITEFDLPFSMCASIVYIGAVIQFFGMIAFLQSCWKTSTWPEPFWNNAIHSCLFTAVCLAGDDKAAQVCRIISILVGFVFLIPNMSIMFVRILMPRTRSKDVVANNPNVAMLQSAFSITCSGWLIAPFTGNAVTGIGGMVGHTLFALSTFGFICTIAGIIQRRTVLMSFGDDPMWVSITFPFANSALAAGLYLKTHPTYSYVLFVWVLILSALAAICIVSVNIMFIKNRFYLFRDAVPPATADPYEKDSQKLHTLHTDSADSTLDII
jgi:hypothetical protein